MAHNPEEDQAPASTLVQLPPLASTIRTFIGKDEHGPLYTRLEFVPYTEQTRDHLPNIIRGLVWHLEKSDPEYVERLHAAVLAQDGVTLEEADDTDSSASEETSDDYAAELRERLAHAETIHEYVGPLVTAGMFNRQTGAPSEQKLRNKLELAKNVYTDDPLVELSRQAADILRDDELNHLAKYTVGAAVVLVEYAGMHEPAVSAAGESSAQTPPAA